jgi:ribosome-binding protein aMBF1 (putative translation factor)
VLTHPSGSFFNPAHDRRAVSFGHGSAVRRDGRRAQKDDAKWIITNDPKRIKSFLMISIEQIRAARGLLGWSQTQLAKAAERSLPTIKRLERDDGEGPSVSEDVRDAVQRALEKAGVEFIAENGGGAGVRMKRRKR